MNRGLLYVVATPIGNLEDITLRAIRILKEVDEIAAEDTRRTRILLRAYEIATPLSSLYDAVEKERTRSLLDKMALGMSIAYVSDAGTPGISDPGFHLINEALRAGIKVVPVPGVSAVVAALSAAGLPMHSFIFHGFLPARAKQRREMLNECRAEKRTQVFYEAPQRLHACLEDIRAVMGRRRLVVARELTKIYEEFIRGSCDDILEAIQDRHIKGEITLIIAGNDEKTVELGDGDILEILDKMSRDTSLSLRDRVAQVAEITGCARKRIYRIALKGKSS